MKKQIERIKSTRRYLLEGIKDLSVDELNEVPSEFNNNIIWNLGHMISAQQGLCYLRSGTEQVIDKKYIATFKSGTKPEQEIDVNEIEIIKDLLFTSLDQLESDYQNRIFGNYTAFTTRYGVEITNIDDAIEFLGFHEGLHSGTISAMKRLVKK